MAENSSYEKRMRHLLGPLACYCPVKNPRDQRQQPALTAIETLCTVLLGPDFNAYEEPFEHYSSSRDGVWKCVVPDELCAFGLFDGCNIPKMPDTVVLSVFGTPRKSTFEETLKDDVEAASQAMAIRKATPDETPVGLYLLVRGISVQINYQQSSSARIQNRLQRHLTDPTGIKTRIDLRTLTSNEEFRSCFLASKTWLIYQGFYHPTRQWGALADDSVLACAIRAYASVDDSRPGSFINALLVSMFGNHKAPYHHLRRRYLRKEFDQLLRELEPEEQNDDKARTLSSRRNSSEVHHICPSTATDDATCKSLDATHMSMPEAWYDVPLQSILDLDCDIIRIDLEYCRSSFRDARKVYHLTEGEVCSIVAHLPQQGLRVPHHGYPYSIGEMYPSESHGAEYRVHWLIPLARETHEGYSSTIDRLLSRLSKELETKSTYVNWYLIDKGSEEHASLRRLNARELYEKTTIHHAAALSNLRAMDVLLGIAIRASEGTASRPTLTPTSSSRTSDFKTSNDEAGKTRLRSSEDIQNRLVHDPNINHDDYVVGYKDRFAEKLMEKDVSTWLKEKTDEEFIPFTRVWYFRRKSDGLIIWDREKKIDRVFGSGNGAMEGMMVL